MKRRPRIYYTEDDDLDSNSKVRLGRETHISFAAGFWANQPF